MAGPRTLLVVNPKSQNGALGRRWPQLSQVVRRHLGSFEEAFTRGPNDATLLTRDALKDGVELVVAIGGDGTINEVANGFFENGTPVLAANSVACMGILPFGTGGDFRKTVHIPKDMERASEILARHNTKRIDLGKLDYTTRDGDEAQRIFINIASFGIGGEIDEQVNKSSKRLGGRLTFMFATARVGMRFKSKRVRVVFDGEDDKAVESTISSVAISNGCYFGGGMHMAPNAVLDDGWFDVVALGHVGVGASIWHSRRLYNGTHLELENVSERRAKTIFAESTDGQEVLLDVDGEAPGMLPATFTMMPEALRLVVP